MGLNETPQDLMRVFCPTRTRIMSKMLGCPERGMLMPCIQAMAHEATLARRDAPNRHALQLGLESSAPEEGFRPPREGLLAFPQPRLAYALMESSRAIQLAPLV
jgi:hypothetical protein